MPTIFQVSLLVSDWSQKSLILHYFAGVVFAGTKTFSGNAAYDIWLF